MEQEEKKVILPWDEYQGLLKDSEALIDAKEELRKDCKERGFYVETKLVFYNGSFYEGPLQDLNPRLSITSKDETLEAAQEEIERLSKNAKRLSEQLEEKERAIEHLKCRNLWKRILNKD